MDRKRMWTGFAIAGFCGLLLAIFVNYEIRKASIPAPVVVMKQIVVAAGFERSNRLLTLQNQAGVRLVWRHLDRQVQQRLVFDHPAGFQAARG